MKSIKIIVLIPVLNPDERLIDLVNCLRKNKYDIIVINDGSDSKYDEIFKCLEVTKVLVHEKNLGKGEAIKTGLKYIKNNYEKLYTIVTMDGDGQHDVEDAVKLISYSNNHRDTLVIGSRFMNKKAPIKSRIGNMVTRNIFKLSTGVKVYDTQSGLRCFTEELIDELINVNGSRYEYEINVLLESAKMRVPIKEIGIKTIYIDNNSSTHFNTLKDSYRIYKEIFKFSLSSILSFIIDFIMYSIFLVVLKSNKYALQLSNVLARFVSSSFNYTINKKYVFKHEGRVIKTIIGYFGLALIILILNTILLTFFVNMGVYKLLAKIIVEVLLFILSFIVQNNFVFKK